MAALDRALRSLILFERSTQQRSADEETYEREQAERLRRRVRAVLAFALAIWGFAFVFADPFLYGSRWGKLGTRIFEFVWAGGLLYWLRKPRPLVAIETFVVAGGCVLMTLSAASLLQLAEDQVVFAVVTRLLGIYFASYAIQLRWRASAVANGYTALALVTGYLLCEPDQGPDRLWLSTMWVIAPVPVLAYASYQREKRQREEIALRRELETANARLAGEIQARARLFLGLNHDLRTPLAIIRAESEAIAERMADPHVKGAAVRITASTAYAADLVDQLLELARLDAGTPWGTPIPHRVDAVAEALVAQLQPAQGARIHINAEPAVVMADPRHVRRILVNLASNALRKIDPVRGNVYVRIRVDGQRVTIDVSDDGPGIPENLVAMLFERFATTEAGSVVSGIGLPLARELAELNGGTLELRDPSKAHFVLALPASDLPSQPFELEKVSASLVGGSPEGKLAHRRNMPRILVVEDNPQLADLLARQLGIDYATVAARTLEQARQEVSMGNFDLVLSDLVLPDGRGYELVDVLRERFGSTAPPLILLSALNDPDAKTAGLLAGADDYLVKPFSTGELRARIERALRRTAERELFLERQRDALLMELHDGVGGSMARATASLASPDPARIEAARAELEEGLRELRSALQQLERGDATWSELAAEIRYQAAEAAEGAGLEFESRIDLAEEASIGAGVAHALRRIVRESTTNVIRHANAKHLGLALWIADGTLHGIVWDNGRGLDGRTPGRGTGVMQRRAARLGGEVVVEARPEGGTQVRVSLPLVARAMKQELLQKRHT